MGVCGNINLTLQFPHQNFPPPHPDAVAFALECRGVHDGDVPSNAAVEQHGLADDGNQGRHTMKIKNRGTPN